MLQDNGTLVSLVDTIFGLCRKKSAGKHVHGSLSGVTVFENQTEVDLFVDSQSNSEWSHSGVHSYSYYYCY